jgi:hypothetical protein
MSSDHQSFETYGDDNVNTNKTAAKKPDISKTRMYSLMGLMLTTIVAYNIINKVQNTQRSSDG